ncbi:uncharacterized protein [Elaeis guineensis]|uniref:Uncharacterized protein LOC109504836 n=1 Tax=Elaeis guineensis var. tenera TaxID=51953 RepID=A0A6J0PAV4_ELAGV|nr:uncharacterized protein LOC109504836 [Elaeis guineensis]
MTDEWWVLHVDGSSNTTGSGVGLILTSPDGVVMEYVLQFGFFASNNEAEYEALVTGLRMVKVLSVRYLRVHSDSQLIVGQIQGEYEVQEPNMIKYLQNVKDLASNFATMNIQQISRMENVWADLLLKLAMLNAANLKRSSYLEILKKLSIEEPSVMQTDLELSWIDLILHYL